MGVEFQYNQEIKDLKVLKEDFDESFCWNWIAKRKKIWNIAGRENVIS